LLGSSNIKAIFFDLGQTLVEELTMLALCMQDSLKKNLPYANTDYKELAYAWGYQTHQLFMKAREKEFMSAQKIHLQALKQLLRTESIPVTDRQAHSMVEEVWQAFIERNKIYPDTIPTLQKLKQSGYRLGIITDCDLDVAEGILQKHRLMNFFDVKIISGEIRAYKPSSIMFCKALELVDCSPNKGIYVGDSEIDIKGAKEIGLVTVIVDRETMRTSQMGIVPDFRINMLSEIPKILLTLDNR